MIDVVGVSELKTVRFVARLIFVVDFLEGHFFGTEKIGQLGQVHAIAQILLALGRWWQFFSNAWLDPPFLLENHYYRKEARFKIELYIYFLASSKWQRYS